MAYTTSEGNGNNAPREKKGFFSERIIYVCESRGDERTPYLTRWFLLQIEEPFQFMICLHKFHRSDDDDATHDHPWDFLTVPLWRGYYDVTEPVLSSGIENLRLSVEEKDSLHELNYKKQRCWPLIPYFRKAEHRHRVELFKDKQGKEKVAYTLVLMFKRRKRWGFFTKFGYKDFLDYFKDNGC